MSSYTDNNNKQFRELIPRYQELGYSFIPLPYKSKIPASGFEWKQYQTEKPCNDTVQKWIDEGKFGNIAIITGKVSAPDGESLVVLDFDSVTSYEKFKPIADIKLGNLTDVTPVVRTSRGYHVYFYVTGVIESKHFPEVDIQAEGKYVLPPPSTHPGGKVYEFINPQVTAPMLLLDLKDIGIDIDQRKPETTSGEDNWITTAMQGVPEGLRDATCTRLAGHYLKSQPPDIAKAILYGYADRCFPPLAHATVDKCVDSIARKEPAPINNGDIYTTPLINGGVEGSCEAKTGQVAGQVRDKSGQDWGDISRKFDDFMSENKGEYQDKRDVGDIIGTSYKDDSFRKLVLRRKVEGKIRGHGKNHNLIIWINKDYTETSLLEPITEKFLDFKLPLGLHDIVRIPSGSVIGVPGFTNSGKSAFLLETAELNALSQPMDVYYWYNEMSPKRLQVRCEDFPLLAQAQKTGKFHAIEQTDFEFKDTLVRDAINIYDYLSRFEELYLVAKDIAELKAKMGEGVLMFALQKTSLSDTGYGGVPSMWLSNLYVKLDVVKEGLTETQGKATIIKAKDWEKYNPIKMWCNYHTGGKHGKLIKDGMWGRG